MLDTVLSKEDHLHVFARKHGRLRFSSYTQEPTENDTQTMSQYNEELNRFNGKSYIYSNFNPKYAQMATTIL